MKRIWSLDNTKMAVLLFITFMVVYVQPLLSYPLFLVLFILAYKSEKSYFWFAFLFILLEAPGGLFSATVRGEIHRLPLFSLGPGMSFSIFEMFMFVFLVKVIKMRNTNQNTNPFKTDQIVLAGVIIIYLFVGIIIGISGRNMILTLRGLLSWSWIVIFVTLLNDKEDVRRLCQLLFPIVFLALASQIYTYVTGYFVDDMLRQADAHRYAARLDETTQFAVRALNSPYILLVCFGMTIYYIMRDDRSFPNYYLYAVLFVSYFTVFLSATRGWIIAFTIMLLFAMIAQGGGTFTKAFGIFFMSIIILYFLMIQFPFLERQIELSWDRMQSIERLAEGDVSAGGTLQRFDRRGPWVMSLFKESPLIGFGFSDEFRENSDEHVGHHSLLLNVGILGYILVMGYFFRWIIYFHLIPGRLTNEGFSKGKGYQAFGILLIGIFIIHSSSTQFIGFYFHHLYKYFVYAFLFGLFIPLYNSDLKSLENSDK